MHGRSDAELIRLFGTDEPLPERRILTAGRLRAELEAGGLRYIRWDGYEVLRAIGFVVRDTRWGTYRLDLADLAVVDAEDRFEVAYRARCSGPEGEFDVSARIVGSGTGRLRFEAEGSSPTGFLTNRTGFVVLHPLEGAVGRPVMVTHGSGAQSWSRFPDLVAPDQPMTDITCLEHEPAPGLSVAVAFEGDVFEMEDHRNWTDASFKTYVRPLARGFPYRIEAGEDLAQAVEVKIDGGVTGRPVVGESEIRLEWDAAPGLPLPQVGLFLDPSQERPSAPIVARIAAMRPGYLQIRTDLRTTGHLDRLEADLALAADLGCRIHLDAVIPGIDAERELASLAAVLSGRSEPIDVLFAIPARDCRSRQPRYDPPGEDSAERIVEAARRLFPGIMIAGGMPVGFPELNRNRPPVGPDLITHATQALVHASDDRSVMETLEAYPDLIRTVRSHAGTIAYRLGPSTIGLPTCASASTPLVRGDNRRSPMASNDPRQRGQFAAAFAIGLAAVSAEVSHLTLAAPTGPFGIVHSPQDWPTPGCSPEAPYPIAEAFATLSRLAARPRLLLSHTGAGRLAAIGAITDRGPQLCMANLTDEPLEVLVDRRGLRAPRAMAMRLRLSAFGMAQVRLDDG